MCALSVSLATADDKRAIVRTMAWSFRLYHRVHSGVDVATTVDRRRRRHVDFSGGTDTAGSAVGGSDRADIRHRSWNGRSYCHWGVAEVILLAALLASIVSFGTIGWIMPAGNQAWRESIAQEKGIEAPLIKGPSEMSFSELDRQSAVAAAAGNTRIAGTVMHGRFICVSLCQQPQWCSRVCSSRRRSEVRQRALLLRYLPASLIGR